MSLELLPTLEKDVVSKKKTSTDQTTETKKEGTSLFDSLLKDAVKEKPQETIKKDPSDSKQTPLSSKQVITKDNEKLEEKETPIKKMVNKLVEIVVDGSKKQAGDKKGISSEVKEIDLKNITKVEVKENSGEKIKKAVDENVKIIKDVSKEISKIVKPKEEVQETEQNVKITKKAQNILEKVEAKVNVIKEATSQIKEEVKTAVVKVTQEELPEVSEKKIPDTLKEEVLKVKSESEKSVKSLEEKVKVIEKTTTEITKEVEVVSKDKNVDAKTPKQLELSEKIDKKVELIQDNANEIQKEIKQIVVTSEELITKIQEFKKEEKITNKEEKVAINKEGKILLKSDETLTSESKQDNKNSILSNGFLTSQKQEKQQVSLQNLHDAKTKIEENKTLSAVKESANILELNPEELEVEKVGKDGESKSELFTKHEKQVQEQFLQNRSLNKMVIEGQKNSDIINEQIQKNITEAKVVQEESKTNTQNKEVVLNLNVPQTVVETIQSKIIGAHQRVGSFMSEVARNMYLNYKPPFTAFRLSLNPANLGTISIIMRANNQDSNLSVSMNMSNNATMESFVENRAALQNALQRQLGEGSNITLNFGMDDGNNSESFNDTMNGSNEQSNSQTNEQEQELNSNSLDEQEQAKSLDYM